MSAVATAAVDPLDVLQRIHQDVRLLRELAGDAIVIEIRQAQPAEPPSADPAFTSGVQKTLDVFEARPGEWIGSAEAALERGIHRSLATKHVRKLVAAGALEHNGRGTRAAKYRFVAAGSLGVSRVQLDEMIRAEDASQRPAGSVAERAERSRVLKDLREHGSTTAVETAKRIKVETALVAEELCWLAANGYVEKPYTRYVLIDRTGGASQ